MTPPTAQRKSQRLPQTESPEAIRAFGDYVDLYLQGRASLRALHEQYCKQTATKPPTKRLETLAAWSSAFGWQERVKAAASEKADAVLEEAAMIDAVTFNRTSRELYRRSEFANGLQIRDLLSMREGVRKPTPKGGVNVNVKVEIQQIAERLAKDLGVEASDLMAEAERIAAGAWGDA